MNTLVTGLIALAERALVPVSPDEPVNLGFESLVDYRKYLTPPAKLEEIANGIIIAQGQARVRANDDPERIGSEMSRQIKTDISSGFLAQSVCRIAELRRTTASLGPFIRITNPGALPVPRLPEGLDRDDFDIHLASQETTRQHGTEAPLAAGLQI